MPKQCEYCKCFFSSKTNLNKHHKNAKYCQKLRDKNVEQNTIENIPKNTTEKQLVEKLAELLTRQNVNIFIFPNKS